MKSPSTAVESSASTPSRCSLAATVKALATSVAHDEDGRRGGNAEHEASGDRKKVVRVAAELKPEIEQLVTSTIELADRSEQLGPREVRFLFEILAARVAHARNAQLITLGVAGTPNVPNPFFGSGQIFQYPSAFRLGAKFSF